MRVRKPLFYSFIVFFLSLNSYALASNERLLDIEGGKSASRLYALENVIGRMGKVKVRSDDTLHIIASRTGSGLAELIRWFPIHPGLISRNRTRVILSNLQ